MYSQTEIDQLAREVEALKESKCPFCGEPLKFTFENKTDKVFHCENCSRNWAYDKKEEKMYRLKLY